MTVSSVHEATEIKSYVSAAPIIQTHQPHKGIRGGQPALNNFETLTCILGRNKDQLNDLLRGDTFGDDDEIKYWFSDSNANLPSVDARMANTYAAAGSDATSLTRSSPETVSESDKDVENNNSHKAWDVVTTN
jgi:hypothetical protein